MTRFRTLVVSTLAVGLLAAVQAAPPIPVPKGPTAADVALATKCKAASFARRPAGQMATAMRDQQIKFCIKNNGVLIN